MRAGERFSLLRIASGDDHGRSCAREAPRDGRADAAVAAGDERDLAGEIDHSCGDARYRIDDRSCVEHALPAERGRARGTSRRR